MENDCQKKAAELGFDLTKQFLTVAFAGMAFVTGLSFSSPGVVSSLTLWIVVAVFGASTAVGLLFLMHGVGRLNREKTYDIYAPTLRVLAGLQIFLVLLGSVLLLPIIGTRRTKANLPVASMEVKIGPQQSVVYPINRENSVVVEVDGGRVRITNQKSN